MKVLKHIGIWLAGIIITLAAATYQRTTGPTYPYRTTMEINDESYDLELIRSGLTTEDA